jgi:hypothetical protein
MRTGKFGRGEYMRKPHLKTLLGSLLAIVVMATLAQGLVSAQGAGSERSLIGSWDVNVTIRDCQSGVALFGFPAMITYSQDGTMQESDLGGPGVIRLNGHGVWQHQNGREYSAAYRWLNFNTDRTYAGKNVVRSVISLSQSGNEYTSTDTGELIDANGNTFGIGCATTTATRFE